GMSQSYGTPDDAESVATIHRALDLGCNLFDTAESYGPFTNEQLLGRALRGRRDQAIIATKFGWDFSAGRRDELNSRPEHIRSVVEQSLQRLSTDYIDVLYQHRGDLHVPIEDVAGAISELVHAGKVRYFGLSEAGANTIRRAHTVHPVSALQTEYSVWERHIEADILPTLRELGIGLVAYAPLGRGFLTGTPRRAEDYPETDYRRQDPRFQAGNYDTNVTAARRLTQLAASKNITPPQLALAWLLHQGPDIVPIPAPNDASRSKKILRPYPSTCTTMT
ncbi:MAG: aldo/keto reductase, partial [Terriglobales bacterium]